VRTQQNFLVLDGQIVRLQLVAEISLHLVPLSLGLSPMPVNIHTSSILRLHTSLCVKPSLFSCSRHRSHHNSCPCSRHRSLSHPRWAHRVGESERSLRSWSSLQMMGALSCTTDLLFCPLKSWKITACMRKAFLACGTDASSPVDCTTAEKSSKELNRGLRHGLMRQLHAATQADRSTQ
jgi:hypothetical protein